MEMTNTNQPETVLACYQSPVLNPEIAISVQNLIKTYKLYNSPMDRLKEALHPLRRKYHHDFFALSNVSFDVKKGETVGIIGKNGSGKSTLLKMITGVLTPTGGRVTVNGKVSALLELGAGFNPELTGVENVFFNSTLMGYTKEEMDERLDQILCFADIGAFANQPVKMYSSGMFVRLAFAVAVNVDPDVLIIDEALSVGDIRFQKKCFSKIEDFIDDGKTIIYVTHDTGSIINICDSAMLLDDGKLVCYGEPREICKNYQDILFTRNTTVESKELVANHGENRDVLEEMEETKRIAYKYLNAVPPSWSTQELRHGNRKAEVIDFGILDYNNARVEMVDSGCECTLFMRILFFEDIRNTFYCFAIRTIQGVELFHTNTDMFNIKVRNKVKGELFELKAKIRMWLAPGEYFLSFVSRDNDTLEYLDRRLDSFQFTVRSAPAYVGGYVNLCPSLYVSSLALLIKNKHVAKMTSNDASAEYEHENY